MIDENKTFKLFGYTSKDLSYGSTKKVLRICDGCGKESLIEYRRSKRLCRTCSHQTEAFRKKMSENNSGSNNPMYGKHHTTETKCKQSKALIGEKNYMWKGGKVLWKARSNAKRRKLFGFIPHNIPHENFHGHHIDFNHVIFIPKELHMSIPHSVVNNKNMDIINNAVCEWYLKYQIVTY